MNWDAELLNEMVDTYKNKRLLSQEQSLLVGFINNIAKSLYKASRRLFDNATHKYILAYKDLCRPVIGVDEATDYSLIEFYGIKSFGHYEVCSYTLCGDIMQLMKEDGIHTLAYEDESMCCCQLFDLQEKLPDVKEWVRLGQKAGACRDDR